MRRVDQLCSHLQDNSYVRVEHRGNIGLLRLLETAPPRSQAGGCVLGQPMRAAILRALRQLEEDDRCQMIVISSTSNTFFSSGIDISNFNDGLTSVPGTTPPTPSLAELTAAIERSPKLSVVSVRGLCASWGLELALAADYCVCTVDAVFRLPESRFGITPCGGGALRLLRRVGVRDALEILCYGRPVYAVDAHRTGLVDAPPCRAKELWVAMEEFLRQLSQSSHGIRGAKAAREAVLRAPPPKGLSLVHRGWYAWVERKLKESMPRERVAPFYAIEAVRLAALHHKLITRGAADEAGYRAAWAAYTSEEAALFRRCMALTEAQATQHLLRASQRTAAFWELSLANDGPTAVMNAAAVATVSFHTVAVIGAGTMGTSIALMLLSQRVVARVILVELNRDRQLMAKQAIEQHLNGLVAADRLTPHQREEMMSHLWLTGSPNEPLPGCLADADLILECAPEIAAIKQGIFERLDRLCKRSTILATGSSALDLSVLASVTARPGQVLGLHFFPPANESPLVEIIRSPTTERWVIQRVMQLLRCLDKYPTVSSSTGGYAGTRLLLAGLYQAYAMLEDGSFPLEVDTVLKRKLRYTRGIFELEDTMGLDVMAMARSTMLMSCCGRRGVDGAADDEPPPSDPKWRATLRRFDNSWKLPSRNVFEITDGLIAAGELGRKTLSGWYSYSAPQAQTWTGTLTQTTAAVLPQHQPTEERSTTRPPSPVSPPSGSDAATPFKGENATLQASTLASVLPNRYPLLSLTGVKLRHKRAVEHRIIACSKSKNRMRRVISEDEVAERIQLSMINEAAKLMAADAISSAADIDCISVYAFGFPQWKGGICYLADHVLGIEQVVYRMKVYNRALTSAVFPPPCDALLLMLEKGLTFGSLSA